MTLASASATILTSFLNRIFKVDILYHSQIKLKSQRKFGRSIFQKLDDWKLFGRLFLKVISSLPRLVEPEVHRAENLMGTMNPEKSSENRSPREERRIDPLKTLLELFRTHPLRDKCDMFHIVEIPLVCQNPSLLLQPFSKKGPRIRGEDGK